MGPIFNVKYLYKELFNSASVFLLLIFLRMYIFHSCYHYLVNKNVYVYRVSIISSVRADGGGRVGPSLLLRLPPNCFCTFWPPARSIVPLAGCNIKTRLETHRKPTILTQIYQKFSGKGARLSLDSTPSASHTDFIQKLLLIDSLMCVAVVALSLAILLLCFITFIAFDCPVAFVNS